MRSGDLRTEIRIDIGGPSDDVLKQRNRYLGEDEECKRESRVQREACSQRNLGGEAGLHL